MAHFLKKTAKPKLFVKECRVPLTLDPILGKGIDVVAMPDSHIVCKHCSSPFFEVWADGERYRITIGCMKCGWDTKLLFPMDTEIKKFLSTGRFECFKHKKAGFVIIKNTDVLCLGCQYCKTEVRLQLKNKSGLVLAN